MDRPGPSPTDVVVAGRLGVWPQMLAALADQEQATHTFMIDEAHTGRRRAGRAKRPIHPPVQGRGFRQAPGAIGALLREAMVKPRRELTHGDGQGPPHRLQAGRVPSELFARDGRLDDRRTALSERILDAGRDTHLGAEPGEAQAPRLPNRRNGSSRRNVRKGTSKVRLDIPRDRVGTFDPQRIVKHQRRFPEFDDKTVSMQARGKSPRAIRDHVDEV